MPLFARCALFGQACSKPQLLTIRILAPALDISALSALVANVLGLNSLAANVPALDTPVLHALVVDTPALDAHALIVLVVDVPVSEFQGVEKILFSHKVHGGEAKVALMERDFDEKAQKNGDCGYYEACEQPRLNTLLLLSSCALFILLFSSKHTLNAGNSIVDRRKKCQNKPDIHKPNSP